MVVVAGPGSSTSPNDQPRPSTGPCPGIGKVTWSSANAMSPVATLVERSTRFVMLVALPGGHKADLVAAALAAKITTLPAALTRTLTWDQGHEMAEHVRFTEETGVEVYFCDPRSPWQRGSNENTNGLLRQYLPRTLDFRTLTQADFDAIADKLNGRPRQTLGFKTPSQALAEVLR
jgi:IS30 family transposase